MATLSTISFPEFFVAYILIALLSVQVIIFPSISNINDSMSFGQKIYAIILPCLTLTLVVMAHMMRQTRAAIINILASPFIEMARLKGIKRLRVIVLHHSIRCGPLPTCWERSPGVPPSTLLIDASRRAIGH